MSYRTGDRVQHNVKPHWHGTVVSSPGDLDHPIVDWDNDDAAPRPGRNLRPET